MALLSYSCTSKSVLDIKENDLIELVFPFEKKVSHWDSNLLELAEIRDLISELKYAAALESISLINTTTISLSEKYILYILKAEILVLQKSDFNSTQQILNELTDITWNKNNLIDQILYLKKVEIESRLEENKSKSFKALGTIHYGLYLIENSKFKSELKYVKAVLLSNKAIIRLSETEQVPFIPVYINQSNALIDSLAGNSLRQKNLLNLGMHHLYNEDYLKAENIFFNEKHSDESNSKFLKIYSRINQAFYYSQIRQDAKAVEVLKSTLHTISDTHCERIRLSILEYLCQSLIRLDEISKARFYLNQMDMFRNCDTSISELNEFFISRIKVKLLQKEFTNIHSLAQENLKHRTAARNIFKNEQEFHLGDFYASNCYEILSLLSNLNSNELQDYKSEIVRLVSDTKNRQLKLQRHKQKTPYIFLSELERKRDDLLRQIDDFKKLDDYGNPIYKELYEVYEALEDQTPVRSEVESLENDDHTTLDVDKTYLEYFTYGDKYFYYLIQNDSIYLHEKMQTDVDSLIQQYTQSIQSEANTSQKLGKELFSKIIPNELSQTQTLTILPSGKLNKVPFAHLLNENFSDTEIVYHYDITASELSKSDTLQSKSSTIFSYSSDATIKSLDKKRYIELEYGLRECKEIHNLLAQSKLYCGMQCSQKKLTNHLENDILHIVTHGYSNSMSRQDCYLIFRNNENEERFYSSEVPSNSVPKFVSLSSCDSGLGHFLISEGVYSMSQAFLKRGTETVIKSLWKIDDEATMEFNTMFYKSWCTGISVSEAFHQTQNYMSMHARFSHPFYWSGLVLEGNPKLYLDNNPG